MIPLIAVSLRFTSVKCLLGNDKIYLSEMGCKAIYKKIFIFVKLPIRWAHCSFGGDDHPSGVDTVPKGELNGMMLCYEIFTLKIEL